MLNEREKKADAAWKQHMKQQAINDKNYFKNKAAKEAASDKKWADFKKRQAASDAVYLARRAKKGK